MEWDVKGNILLFNVMYLGYTLASMVIKPRDSGLSQHIYAGLSPSECILVMMTIMMGRYLWCTFGMASLMIETISFVMKAPNFPDSLEEGNILFIPQTWLLVCIMAAILLNNHICLYLTFIIHLQKCIGCLIKGVKERTGYGDNSIFTSGGEAIRFKISTWRKCALVLVHCRLVL